MQYHAISPLLLIYNPCFNFALFHYLIISLPFSFLSNINQILPRSLFHHPWYFHQFVPRHSPLRSIQKYPSNWAQHLPKRKWRVLRGESSFVLNSNDPSFHASENAIERLKKTRFFIHGHLFPILRLSSKERRYTFRLEKRKVSFHQILYILSSSNYATA